MKQKNRMIRQFIFYSVIFFIAGCQPNKTKEKVFIKKDLGFHGVIVSDAMVTGGFRRWYDNELEGEIQSFMAGLDVMLWPSYTFMDTLEARITRGEIPIKRLNDAVQRVWTLKERFDHLQLYDDEAQSTWAVNAIPKDKIIVISFGSPFLINEYFESVNTCINAHSNTPLMNSAMIAALRGEVKMTGLSPIDLDLKNYVKE